MQALRRLLGRKSPSRKKDEHGRRDQVPQGQIASWKAQPIEAKIESIRTEPDLVKNLLAAEREVLPSLLAACHDQLPADRPPPPVHQDLYVSFLSEKQLDGVPLAVPYTERWENYSLDRRLLNADGYLLDQMPLRRLLAPGGAMIDIGAHIGMASVAHGLLGDFDRIHAIEPTLQNFDCLVANIAWNGLTQIVQPHRVALGEADRAIRMRIKGGSGRHFVLQENKKKDPRPNEEVQQRTFDSFIETLGDGKIDYVKSDTQGFEGRVLMGAEAFLANRQAIWEITFAPYTLHRRSRIEPEAFRGLITGRFQFFIICEGSGLELLPIDGLGERLDRVKATYADLFLIP